MIHLINGLDIIGFNDIIIGFYVQTSNLLRYIRSTNVLKVMHKLYYSILFFFFYIIV